MLACTAAMSGITNLLAGLIQLQSIAGFAVGLVCELNFEGQRSLKKQNSESSGGHVQW